MLRYSRTALRELSRMYRAVLKHCLLMSLSLGMTVSPVFADITGNQDITEDKTWTESYNDENSNIKVTDAKLTVSGSGFGIRVKDMSLFTTGTDKTVTLEANSFLRANKTTLSGTGTSKIGVGALESLSFSLENNVKGEVSFDTFKITDDDASTSNGMLSLAEGANLTLKGKSAPSDNNIFLKNIKIAKDATLTAKENVKIDFSKIRNFSNEGLFDVSDFTLENFGLNTILQIEGSGTVSTQNLKVAENITLSSNNDFEVKNSFSNKGQVFLNGTLTIDNSNSNINDDKKLISVKTLKVTSGSTIKSGKESTLLFSYLDNEGVVISNASLFLFSDTSSEETTQTGTIENKGTIKIEDADGVTRTADHTLYIYDNVEFKNTGTISVGVLENIGRIIGEIGIIDIKSNSVNDVSLNAGSITGSSIKLENITFKNTGSIILNGTLDLINNAVFENASPDLSVGGLNISSTSTFKTSQPFYIYGGSNQLDLYGTLVQSSGLLHVNGVTNIYETGKLLVVGDINVIGGVSNSGIISGTGTFFAGSTFVNYKEVSVASLQVNGAVTNNDKMTILGDGLFSGVLNNTGTINAQNISFTGSSGYINDGTIIIRDVFKDNGFSPSYNTNTLKVGTYISDNNTNNTGTIEANSITILDADWKNNKEIKTTDFVLKEGDYIQDDNGALLSAQNVSISRSGSNVTDIEIEKGSVTVQGTMNIIREGMNISENVHFGTTSKVKIGSFVSKDSIIRNDSTDFVTTSIDLTGANFANSGTITTNTLRLSKMSNFNNDGTLNGLSSLKIEDDRSIFSNGVGKTLDLNISLDINGHFENYGEVNSFSGNVVAGKSAVIETSTGEYTDDTAYKFIIQNAKVSATSGAQMIGNFLIADNGSFELDGDISSSNNIFKLGQNVTMTVYTNSAKVNTLYKWGENATLNMIVDSYRDEAFSYTIANNFIGSDFETIPTNNLYNISKTTTPGTYLLSKKSPAELRSLMNVDENQAKAIEAMMGKPTNSSAFNNFYQGVLRDMQSADPVKIQDLAKKVELMNPETTPAVPTVSQEISNQIYSAVSTRLSGGYISAYGPDVYGQSGGEGLLEGWSSWTQLLYSKGKYSENSYGFSSKSQGFAFGLENYYGYDIKYGFGYSFMKTKVNIDSGRKTDGKTHTIFAYGEYSPSEWFFNDIMTYSFMSTDEKSSVKNASYDTQFFSNQITAGYQFEYDDFDFVPSVGVRYQHAKNKAYKDSLSNKIEPGKSNTVTGVLGIAIGTDFDCYGMYFRPELRAAYTYDFQHPSDETQVTLANNNHYVVRGVNQKREGYELGLSFLFDISDEVEFSLNYEGHFKKGYRENTGMINFKYEY